jgi:hypothetical protein
MFTAIGAARSNPLVQKRRRSFYTSFFVDPAGRLHRLMDASFEGHMDQRSCRSLVGSIRPTFGHVHMEENPSRI